MNTSHDCIFCKIVHKDLPAFITYEDYECIAFLDLRQVRQGHTLLIPKTHTDHFMDLPDNLAKHLMEVAQQISRKIRTVFNPPRVGYVVAGYGVAHAHLHIQPMWEEHDITSQRYLDIRTTPPSFNINALPIQSEEERLKTCSMLTMPVNL